MQHAIQESKDIKYMNEETKYLNAFNGLFDNVFDENEQAKKPEKHKLI